MNCKETKDLTFCVPDINVDSSVNAEVFAPLRKGMSLENPTEMNIRRSSNISITEMALEPMTWLHEEKIDKETRTVPISRSSEKRIKCEKVNDLMLNEEMSITCNRQIKRQIQSLEIKTLNYEYFKNDTILFKIPDYISGCEKWVKTQIGLVWQRLEDEMGAKLSLQLDNHDLRVRGTYCHSCTVCYFDSQVWKSEFGIWSEGDYGLEFRRTSLNGQQAFGILVHHVASWLKKLGAAEEFGNRRRILPYGDELLDIDNLSCWEYFSIDDLENQSTDEESVEDTVTRNRTKDTESSDTEDYQRRFEDLDDSQCDESVSTAMVSLCSKPIEQRVSVGHKNLVRDPKKMNCMIRLGDNLLGIWSSQIEQRIYPAAGETIRTLRMCCHESDIDANVRAVRGNKALLNALCIELEKQSARVPSEESNMYKWANAEVCINILEIVHEVIKSPSNDEFVIEKNIM